MKIGNSIPNSRVKIEVGGFEKELSLREALRLCLLTQDDKYYQDQLELYQWTLTRQYGARATRRFLRRILRDPRRPAHDWSGRAWKTL